MVTTTQKRFAWNTLALALVLPTVFFIGMSILKYEFGVNEPFDSFAPWLENAGIKDFGWNINLLILFGPILAVLIAVFQVLHIRIHAGKTEFRFDVTVYKRWVPFLIIILSGLVLTTLFLYMVGENCNC